MTVLSTVLAGLAATSIALSAAAADNSTPRPGGFPTKPIRWVIPFAAGGGTDVVARPIALKLGDRLGQPITYDNRGGGGGIIAAEIVTKSAPDGYTMLVAAVAVMTVTPSLTKVPYDPVKDFSPITKFANVPNMLVARAAFPPRTLQEIISYAKANPGKVAWAISGPGSGGHLAMESFRLTTGINVIRVPYKGAGPATVALISNEADLLFANPGVFMPHIKAGRLRPIAAASLKRMPLFPDLATFNESGFPGFESGSWYGLAAPARTSPAIVAFMHKEVVAVLNQPDIVSVLATEGASIVGNSPQEFGREIRDDLAKWAKVIKEANITF